MGLITRAIAEMNDPLYSPQSPLEKGQLMTRIGRLAMKKLPQNPSTLLAAPVALSALLSLATIPPADDNAAKPYKVLTTTQIPAAGGIDYVTADSVNRRVYVACGNAVSVFDLDTYKLAGTLAKASGHGVAIDPENHTGLVSGNP